MEELEALDIQSRIANCLFSYLNYIGKMLWPYSLGILYPHPGKTLPLWQATCAGLLLAMISLMVLRAYRHHHYLFVEWCWYLITLVPVIGVVQVGIQANADRFTYIPIIDLFIMKTWAGQICFQRGGTKRLFIP